MIFDNWNEIVLEIENHGQTLLILLIVFIILLTIFHKAISDD